MTRRQHCQAWGVAALLGAYAAVSLAGAGEPAAGAQSGRVALVRQKDAPMDAPVQGSSACQGCHEQPDPKTNITYKDTRGFDFVRLQENQVWGKHDLHAMSYENLLNDLGKKMEARLQVSRGAGYKVTTDVDCLACHATLRDPGIPPAKRKVSDFLEVSVPDPADPAKLRKTVEGVGCESCHGPGRDYMDEHQKFGPRLPAPTEYGAQRAVAWRTKDAAAKAEKGFVNLRDPAVAVAKCAACHVGDAADGKLVTHAMYAAGHPPLPPFDLLSYSRELPRHWGLPREMPYLKHLAKKDTEAKADTAWKLFHYRSEEGPDGEVYVARRFAESAIATLEASARLLEQQLPPKGGEGKFDGLDFAAFDCYSCHHDLKYPSDRQARPSLGPPGRPQFRAAQFALPRVVVVHAATMPDGVALADDVKQLDAVMKELAMTVELRPYGDAARLRAAAEHLRAWCGSVRGKLAAVRYTREQTRQLMAAITNAALGPVADPEVAELYVWAFNSLRIELRDSIGGQDPPGWEKAFSALAATAVGRLRTNVPDSEVRPTDELPPANTKSVADRLPDRTRVLNGFRTSEFHKAFAELDKLVPK